ncbi:peroxiredoxin [Bradyrhizobium sp. SSBR45G]|uniref:peroxiredoxin n=1 Tax=unclassified Bradyrhizobium TaxID=2631580 RepID=UPI00234292E5|nr:MULTISPECIES: peroxiredoxin [unclassified Bradyrhizobium]GLH75259.1 peroxiredoxin [Bradyrhizobium sp. SSBR45G]GLH82954.1 peroxiredoxin [Bradyrhizobium sp. SSBR45R]
MSKESRKKSSNPASYGAAAGNRVAAAAKKVAKKTTAKAAKPVSAKAAVAKASVAKPAAKTKAAAPAAAGTGLAEGAKAPAFKLPRDGGGTVSLADYAGKKLVLFFYPKANTPGCTKEAIDFTRLSKDFAAAGAAVLGVSADSVKAQDNFRDKHDLTVPLGSDETHEMLEAYGAWGEKSLYGRKFLGIIRSTVLIGADGRVAKLWRNVKVDGHADAVLAVARAL